MKPDTKPVIEKLIAKFASELDNAFNSALEEEDREERLPTPAALFKKRYDLAKVGEKFTVGAAMSIVKTGDPMKPQCKVKVSVTLKAATPDGDYQELFDLPCEENEGA